MQIDAEIVGQHELHPAHHILRARELADVDEQAAGGNRAPVDPPGIQRARLVAPVGKHFQPLVGDHARAMGDGVAGALADQVRRQVPIGVERGIADQAGHFRRRHGALADDDAHRVADASVLDHPQPGRGGVDQDIAALDRRDRPCPFDIGEDQPLIISRAAIQRGDGGGVGAAGDGETVDLLEAAEQRRGIGACGEAEALAQLLRAIGRHLQLRQSGPAGAIGGEATDEAVIGRIARQGGAGEICRRGRGGERIKQSIRVRRGGGETGVDIAHGVALRGAGAVAGGVEEGLTQHHVGAQPGAAVAGADRVQRIHHVRPGGQQVEQGLVRAVGPDRLEIPFGVEGGERRGRLESGRASRSRPRPCGRRLRRGAVGRDRPEGEREAGGTQEAGQRSHGGEISQPGGQVQPQGGRGGALSRTDAARLETVSFGPRPA